MKPENDLLNQSKVFVWIGLATPAILTLPFLAMTFNWQMPEPGSSASSTVDWSLSDFIIMGSLIFGMASLFVLAARKVAKKNRLAIGILFALAFLLIWAELAVGVFGSPFAGS